MELQLAQEAIAFLWSVVMGLIFGICNDIFRVGRILKKAGGVRLFFEDLLLSLVIAFSTFWCLALTHDGQVRLFLLLGELCGFIFYFNTLGRLVLAAAGLLARFLQFLKRQFSALGRRFGSFFKKL